MHGFGLNERAAWDRHTADVDAQDRHDVRNMTPARITGSSLQSESDTDIQLCKSGAIFVTNGSLPALQRELHITALPASHLTPCYTGVSTPLRAHGAGRRADPATSGRPSSQSDAALGLPAKSARTSGEAAPAAPPCAPVQRPSHAYWPGSKSGQHVHSPPPESPVTARAGHAASQYNGHRGLG